MSDLTLKVGDDKLFFRIPTLRETRELLKKYDKETNTLDVDYVMDPETIANHLEKIERSDKIVLTAFEDFVSYLDTMPITIYRPFFAEFLGLITGTLGETTPKNSDSSSVSA